MPRLGDIVVRAATPLLAVMSITFTGTTARAQAIDSLTIAGLKWRAVGPANVMGRLSDVVGIPSPSKTLFIAAAAGGIWKSTNNGITWRPVFDDKRVVSMGVLAIAPSDTMQVWAGTGEPNVRYPSEPGGGVFKSTDGGLTWHLTGLEKTKRIGRIVVDPTNPDVVYVAALGALRGANPERGLYKTVDGGRTWKLIKFINDSTGFVDVAMDPRDHKVLYAASWQVERTPYSLRSGGAGSALWKSRDAGQTWTEIQGHGFPEGVKGRIGLAIAPSDPNLIYAMVEAARPRKGGGYVPEDPGAERGLYRSTDAGATWTLMNKYDDRPFYYSQVRVDPERPNRVYFSSSPLQLSDDGGRTSHVAAQGVHTDTHGIWIDPRDPERWVIAHDGGVSITFDRGGNFYTPENIPLTQFYEVAYDYAVPYNICGGAQDDGILCGPTRRKSGALTNAAWSLVAGGDAVSGAPDPTNPDFIYTEIASGRAGRLDLKTGERTIFDFPAWQDRYLQWEDSIATLRGNPLTPPSKATAAAIRALRVKQHADSVNLAIRFNYVTPLLMSPHDPATVYIGANKLFMSTRRGDDLRAISPDLSKQLSAKIDTSLHWTGGVSLETTETETYGVIVALAESYVKAGLLFVGTDDGNVWMTHDTGAKWERLTDRFPGLPATNPYVARIEPSHFDTLTFYVAFDNHRVNDPKPYLYITTDGGKSFRSIASNLPSDGAADYLHVVREDPHNANLLFVGTSIGVYTSWNRGATWQRFMTGLPSVPIFDLKIHPRDRELIAGTHGRSFWLVDVAPLEQLTPTVAASSAYLFKPKPAFQWGEGVERGGPSDGQSFFEIPSIPYGAAISYRLGTGVTDKAVQIAISDPSGRTVATLQGPGGAGLHTVTWNYQRHSQSVHTLSPSERRDSVLLAQRAPHVLDSLQRAGYDSLALNRARLLITMEPSGPRRRRGGGGGEATATCEHPMTQWDTFCERPAEGALQRPRPVLGGPFTNPFSAGGVDAAKVTRVFDIIGITPFSTGARGRFSVGAPSTPNEGPSLVGAGQYTVTLTAGGQTMHQPLSVQGSDTSLNNVYSPRP
jgi:photosystem II stability/assembly factor-like uncharacterized protein